MSSFSIMGDIIDKQSNRMYIDTLNSIQTIKYGLKAADKTAIEYFKRRDIVFDPVSPKLSHNIRTAWKIHQNQLEKNKEEVEAKKNVLSIKNADVVSKTQAKKIAAKATKRARKEHCVKLLQSLAKRRKISTK